jgi:hypothetical protein
MKASNSIKCLAVAIAAAGFVGSGDNAYADGGIFGSDEGLQLNGGAFTFYENTLQTDPRHAPLVSGGVTAAPTLVTPGLPASLGNFNPFTGDSLLLIGGEALTFKNGPTDVTGASVNYSIDGGAFSSISLTFNEDNVTGMSGDQRWANTNFAINLLSGQSMGTHTLSFYISATTNGNGADPTVFDNNGGANFNTTFTLVPEPSTWATLLVGLGILIGAQRRRRRLG